MSTVNFRQHLCPELLNHLNSEVAKEQFLQKLSKALGLKEDVCFWSLKKYKDDMPSEILNKSEKMSNTQTVPDKIEGSSCFCLEFQEEPTVDKVAGDHQSVASEVDANDLSHIKWEPMRCPVGTCRGIFGRGAFAGHYLEQCCKKRPIQRISLDQAITLDVNYKELPFASNYCLGFLLFDAKSSYCRNEASRMKYPTAYKGFTNHLPILLLACRTHVNALLGDLNQKEQYQNCDNSNSELLVVWLSTVSTKRPLRAALRATNCKGVVFRETSGVLVRDLHDTQVVEDFLGGRMNYLMLNGGTLKQLSSDGPGKPSEDSIQIKVTMISD